MDEKELTAELMRLHQLIAQAAEQARQQSVSAQLIDKLTSAQIRIELLLKKLRPAAGP